MKLSAASEKHPLKLLRARRGVTQKQVAKLLGVTPTTVHNWEAGRHQLTLSPVQFVVLTNTLNCTIEDFLSESDREKLGAIRRQSKTTIKQGRLGHV